MPSHYQAWSAMGLVRIAQTLTHEAMDAFSVAVNSATSTVAAMSASSGRASSCNSAQCCSAAHHAAMLHTTLQRSASCCNAAHHVCTPCLQRRTTRLSHSEPAMRHPLKWSWRSFFWQYFGAARGNRHVACVVCNVVTLPRTASAAAASTASSGAAAAAACFSQNCAIDLMSDIRLDEVAPRAAAAAAAAAEAGVAASSSAAWGKSIVT